MEQKKKVGKEDIEELIKRKEELRITMDRLEKISADELLREKYAAREKARLDAISSMAYVEKRGLERGLEKGEAIGIVKGRAEGEAIGRAEGKAEGEAIGRAEGKAETLIRQFTRKLGILPSTLQDSIRNASLSTLDLLADEIFNIVSIKEIEEIIEKQK